MDTATVTLSNGKTRAMTEAQVRQAIDRKVTKVDKARLTVEDFQDLASTDPDLARWTAKVAKHAADLRTLADALETLTSKADVDVQFARAAAKA